MLMSMVCRDSVDGVVGYLWWTRLRCQVGDINCLEGSDEDIATVILSLVRLVSPPSAYLYRLAIDGWQEDTKRIGVFDVFSPTRRMSRQCLPLGSSFTISLVSSLSGSVSLTNCLLMHIGTRERDSKRSSLVRATNGDGASIFFSLFLDSFSPQNCYGGSVRVSEREEERNKQDCRK